MAEYKEPAAFRRLILSMEYTKRAYPCKSIIIACGICISMKVATLDSTS